MRGIRVCSRVGAWIELTEEQKRSFGFDAGLGDGRRFMFGAIVDEADNMVESLESEEIVVPVRWLSSES